jgi:hypothetical protein
VIRDVTETKNNNAPVFITVLCACLGLLVVGVPAEANARQASTEMAHYRASSIRLSLAASVVSSLPALKIDDRWLPASASQGKGWPEIVSYENSKALGEIKQFLNITCLPRASLSDKPGETVKG